jgi:Arc/MetJ-type ribon-helix-helix transcriptional regulator
VDTQGFKAAHSARLRRVEHYVPARTLPSLYAELLTAICGIVHLVGWSMDGNRMAERLSVDLRRKDPESEKITINLGYIDLGQIDLLVQEGFYSNRTDFIRTAIRGQLSAHTDVLKQTVERLHAAGERLHIQVLGLATIDDDVPAQLAAQTIASIVVLGALRATPEVKAALSDRIR